MNGVRLVVRRELRLQLRSRGFLIGILMTAVIVAAAVCVPQLLSRGESFDVALVGAGSQSLAEPLGALAEQSGVDLRTSTAADRSAAGTALEEGTLDAAVIDAELVLSRDGLDPSLSGLLQSAHEAAQVSSRLAALDLPAQQVQQALSVPPLREQSLDTEDRYASTRQGIALLIMLSLLYLLMTMPVAVATGVVEEKGSRIVEILLVALKPVQLLTGKLIAFGVLGLVQLVVFAATGIGAAYAVDLTGDLPPGMPQIVAVTFVAYVLGFLFFGALAAALSSMVSRQEETNGALTPMTAAVVLSYVAAYVVVSKPDLLISQVLTVLPPVSTVALPVQIAAGNAEAWHVVVGLGGMLLAIVAVVALSGRIYERSVLRVGTRLKLTEAIRGAA